MGRQITTAHEWEVVIGPYPGNVRGVVMTTVTCVLCGATPPRHLAARVLSGFNEDDLKAHARAHADVLMADTRCKTP